uniref:Aminoglycoside phosphotransferase domain-containing protein n=1 Tax=Odontella aurita TaxID=265563 RepID=A0A7S4J0A3_9STRA
MSNSCSSEQELLPILKHALPTVISYTLPPEKVVQANAEGTRIFARHLSSTLSEKADNDNNNEDDHHGAGDGSRLLVDAYAAADGNIETEEMELFLKRVTASSYAHKSWTDMRRTMVYLRTEVRFYNEIAPLLVESSSTLQKYLPVVHHSDYNLDGLVPEDSPATDAKQPSPFPEESEDEKNAHLKEKGGHILLQSLSPSHGYFQNSPIPLNQAMSCLTAAAELHASAWGNRPLLQTINDRLSSAGGSYQLQFRNPKEIQNMVASWDHFRTQFVSVNSDTTSILEKESVIRLGQRMYDMAEYVSEQLTPLVDDEYATIVHGDYKSMNVFLKSDLSKDADDVDDDASDDGSAIMIDFSCVGIGLGMSDVGMHIVHAVLPTDLKNGGEEQLLDGYILALEGAVNRNNNNMDNGEGTAWTYPRDVAMRHYQLACIDYLRFIMGRFWRIATPESFEKKKGSKNTTLINRNLDSAMAFIEKVDRYLEVFEKEKSERQSD